MMDSSSRTFLICLLPGRYSVCRLAAELPEVDGYQAAMTAAPQNPVYLAAGQARLHAACPVPCGVIKAIEVACSLALPKDVSIKLSR